MGFGPRRRRWWLQVATAGALLVLVGATGYALAHLVAALSSAPRPATTLAPSAPAATPPVTVGSPTPLARGTPSPSASAGGSPRPRVHVVARGEYVSLIARRYGVSVQALLDANDLSDPNHIEVGQRLVIPDRP
ncbi:MAG: LysM peptidoglycan-binding domain-containing protein [Chloroflexota bacterium]|nr:LysM peptidoglycan-binding domain-containing protein [Chloroflexota bacterium]